MKTVNKITTGVLALMAVLFLDACSKTKNSTPSTSNTTAVCPTTGYYMAGNGQNMQCQPGTQINTAYTTGYNGNNYPTGVATCQQYTQYYGIQYVPVQNGPSIDCVRYDWISQYAGGSSYANYGADYYYYNPPEVSSYSNGGSWASNLGLFVNFNF